MTIIQWLGTSGFLVEAEKRTFLFDPYLSGASGSTRKKQAFKLDRLKPELVFVSHGHVDHAGDLPWILQETDAMALCNATVGDRLMADGIARERIILVSDGTRYYHKDYDVRVFGAPHAASDFPGAVRGLMRTGPRVFKSLALLRKYPAGLTVSICLCLPGCRILHFGSLGAPGKALERIAAEGQPDILLLPLQRHRGWLEKALKYATTLKPRVLIPHHHDDSMPPFSEAVDIRPALDAMASALPKMRVVKLRVMESVSVEGGRGIAGNEESASRGEADRVGRNM